MSDGPAKFDPDKVWLGVTPTLWWNDDFPSIDIGVTFEQCISEMALAGYQGCSIGHKYPTDRDVLKRALDLRGLRVTEPWVSTYFTIKDMEQQTLSTFERQLEFIKAMGGTDIVVAEFGGAVNPLPVAVFSNRPIFDDQQWEALSRGMNRLGQMAKDAGMRLCYHHHMGTGVMMRPEVDRLMESTDPNLVNLLFDTGHLAFAGGDPLELAQAYGERIKHVHLKDVRADIAKTAREQHYSFQDAIEAGVFTVPGDGSIDFVPIFDVLAQAGFEGWLVVEAEQDPAKATPLEYARKGREYLREVLGW
ncbi:MAG TPA: myo-inosose-2 dehydratase [Solirubrobacteraceae bacterium]